MQFAQAFDRREQFLIVLILQVRHRFEIYVSHPRDSHDQKTKLKEKHGKIPAKGFEKDDFKYDKERDVFECPEGKVLRREGNGSIDKRTGTRKYKYNCRECGGCIKMESRHRSKKGRSIKVTEFFNEINEFREMQFRYRQKITFKKERDC